MLPKLKAPTFKFELPSTKESITLRQMTIAEEKILLVAKQENESDAILRSIVQVVNNCLVGDSKRKVEDWSLTDLSYIFVKLRGISVSNKLDMTYTFEDDNESETVDFSIDLDKDVTIKKNKDRNHEINVNDQFIIVMTDIPVSLLLSDEYKNAKDQSEIFSLMIDRSIESISTQEEVTKFKDYKQEERTEFVDNLPAKTFSDMQKFFDDAPSIYCKKVVSSKKGSRKETIELTTLADFFLI